MRKIRFSLTVVLSFCSISTAVADDEASFKDLHGVGIVLEPLSPEVETAGLRQTDIQTDVELKLRLAGIPVLSRDEWTRTSGAPILYVNVSVFLSTTPDTWAFNVEADLSQDVKLVRSPAIIVPNATTWRTFVVGFQVPPASRNVRLASRDGGIAVPHLIGNCAFLPCDG
jgi:hypothetical protein